MGDAHRCLEVVPGKTQAILHYQGINLTGVTSGYPYISGRMGEKDDIPLALSAKIKPIKSGNEPLSC
jgi:hypothetical protein